MARHGSSIVDEARPQPSTTAVAARLGSLLETALLEDLSKLSEAIVREISEMMGAGACTLYLLPQFVREFDGELVEWVKEPTPAGDVVEIERKVPYTEIERDYIVIANSTHAEPASRPFGKAFYRSGEGLTGWVFEQRCPLLLRNMWDRQERAQIKPEPHHTDKYGLGLKLSKGRVQPFVAVPLQGKNGPPIGVLKLTDTHDHRPFDPHLLSFLESLARVLTTLVRRSANLERMGRMKKLLARIGAAADVRTLLQTVADEVPSLVEGLHCSLFLLDEKDRYVLRASSRGSVLQSEVDRAFYWSGEGLTGWVAANRRPLLLRDLRDREELARISPPPVWKDKHGEYHNYPTRQFLAVPLLSSRVGDRALGVLRIPVHRFNQGFNADDLALVEDFARNFVPILAAFRAREFAEKISNTKDLLLQVLSDRERLLSVVVENTHRILGADGCSLFTRDERTGQYALVATSVPEFREHVGRLSYRVGEGKTGRVLAEKRPLRLNTIEDPKISVKNLVETVDEPRAKFLAAPILAESGDVLGAIRLPRRRNKPDFSEEDENLLVSIASMVGLALRKLDLLENNRRLVQAVLSIAETNVRLVQEWAKRPLAERREYSFWLALTTVTFHGGLRFNRAALLTIRHNDGLELAGVCGVGPESDAEVDANWKEAEAKTFDEVLRINMERAQASRGFHRHVAALRLRGSQFDDPDRLFGRLAAPAGAELGQAYRVTQGRVERVTENGFQPVDDTVPAAFLEFADCDAFALVPFHELEGGRGLLYVDNRYNHRSIELDQIRPLVTFTEFFETSTSLAEAQEKLLRSSRMATLGQFATAVGHQAAQPLQVISGAAQLLARDPRVEKTENVGRCLSELHEGVARIGETIRRLETFVRRRPVYEPVAFDLSSAVSRVVDFIGAQLTNRNIVLELHVPEDLPQVLGDPARIEDVLLNLIANARDAMEATVRPKTLGLLARSVDGGVEVQVSDTGCGIPNEHRPHLFEWLFTTKPPEKGMGMGLSYSRDLVSWMGGHLWLADSEVDRGSTFAFRLRSAEGTP